MGWLQIILVLLAFLTNKTPDNANDVRGAIADDLGSPGNPTGDASVASSLGGVTEDSTALPADVSSTGLDDPIPDASVATTTTTDGTTVDDPFTEVGTSVHGGVDPTSSPIPVEDTTTASRPLIINKDGTPIVVPGSSTTPAVLGQMAKATTATSGTATSGTSSTGLGGVLSNLGTGTAALLGFGAGATASSSTGLLIIIIIVFLLLAK